MVFSTACFLAYFWATYFVPETANASLEEIDRMFRSSAGREDVLLKQQVCCGYPEVLWLLIFFCRLKKMWD